MSNKTTNNKNNNYVAKEYFKAVQKQLRFVLIPSIISIVLLELVVVILVQKIFGNWLITILLALIFIIILRKGAKREQSIIDEINKKYPEIK